MKSIISIFLGAFLVVASSSAFAQQQPHRVLPRHLHETAIQWLQNYNDAVSQSQATGKPILILFTGTQWCPACMKLEHEVLRRPEFIQALGSRFIFLKAEFPDYGEEAVRTSPYKSLLEKYGVNAFPSMIIIQPDGQALFVVNYQPGGADVYIRELLQKLNFGHINPSMNTPSQSSMPSTNTPSKSSMPNQNMGSYDQPNPLMNR